jgi:zinc protease
VALTAAINQLRSGYQLHAGAQGVTASLHTERSQLDGALALLHDMLREPVFEPTEFAIEKNVRLENLAAARKTTDPDRLATRALSRHFAGNWPAGDLRHEMTFDEEQQELDRLSLEGVKTFYETFYGVNEGELVIVGDIDPPQVTTTLTALFGDWRASKPYAFAEEPYVDVKPARFQIQTADRANAVYTARANLPVYLDHPDRLAVEVANHLLGGGDKSRLFQRIRTQEGLSYGIYSSLNFGRIDKWSSWRIHGTFAPENRAKVEALVKEEIEKVRREGFTQQELDDLKAGWMQNMQARLANESYQLGMLERLLRWQEPLDRNDREIAALRALTLADVNRAMQQYLNPERLSIAVAGNFGDSAGTGDSPTASSSH